MNFFVKLNVFPKAQLIISFNKLFANICMFEYSCACFALPTASHAIANTTDRLAV